MVPASTAGAHALPFHFSTSPEAGAVPDTARPCNPPTLGLAYVPAKEPPDDVAVVRGLPAEASGTGATMSVAARRRQAAAGPLLVPGAAPGRRCVG